MKEIENKITWNLNCIIKTRLHQILRKINLVHNKSKINHDGYRWKLKTTIKRKTQSFFVGEKGYEYEPQIHNFILSN
jgi:hypothetical protein